MIFGSPEGWGNESAEELIVAADASIASAITKSPSLEGKQPTKVVLGLPEHWVSGNTVNPQKTAILQSVCRKLLLKSLGFVITPEAIAHFLRQEEGGLPSAILVNISEAEIVVSLISQGKFLGSKVVGRSNSLALDLEEGLLRFDFQGVLPNRILLLQDADFSDDIEGMKQTLVAYSWVGPEGGKKLNFLQLPKVEVAEPDFEIRAVVVAGKHELGLEGKKAPVAVQEEAAEKAVAEQKVEEAEEEPEKEIAEPTENFGFIQDEDILLNQPVPEVPPEETPLPPAKIAEEKELSPSPVSRRKLNFSLLLSLPRKLSSRLKFPRPAALPRPQLSLAFNKSWLLLPLPVVVILAAGFFLFYNFARAEVKILVQPQKIDGEFEFSAAKTGEVDMEKMTVPAREVSVEVSGSKTAGVTGKKTVGDRAKGEVVIYNGGTSSLIFAKGAAVKGSGGLRFTLDQEVKVASASVDWTTNPPQPKLGENKITLTAADIGAQYNVAANSEFVPEKGSFSSLKVKNLAAFSGGTSREIQAVSKEDRENLQKSLLADLEKKARQEVTGKLAPEDYLLEDSLQLKNKIDNYNRAIDEEAGDLTLDEKAAFVFLFVKADDFKILADKTISPLIPEGYRAEALKEEKVLSAKDKVKGVYTARVNGEYLPALSLEGIPARLKGKTVASGGRYLGSLDKTAGYSVAITPKLFSVLRLFPLKEQNITVTMQTL